MLFRRFFFLLFLAAVLPLHAEVFSLWPFQPRAKQSPSPDSFFETLNGNPFWRENVFVNGVRAEMRIAFSDLALNDAASLLRRAYPHGRFAANSNSLLAEYRTKDGRRMRLYLLQLKGVHSLVEFAMEIPRKGMSGNGAWPTQIPEIPGSSNVTVMEFPARKALCVTFDLRAVTRAGALLDLGSRLKSAGWQTASGEISGIFEGSGDVFMRENPLEILIAGVTELEGGIGVRAALYQRSIKGGKQGK